LWVKEGGIEKIRRRVLSGRLIAGAGIEDQYLLEDRKN
jgi:hypothetical protein